MANDFLQGVQVGSNIMGERLNRDLRYQELKSQDALRRVQERAAVQEMELQLAQRNEQIQFQSEMSQAVGAAGLLSSPVVMTPMGPIPNPQQLTEEQAVFRTVIPVLSKRKPELVLPALENMALRRVQMDREKRLDQESTFQPSIKTLTDKSGGAPVRGVQETPRSFRVLPEKTSTEGTLSPFGKQLYDLRVLKQKNADPKEIQMMENKLLSDAAGQGIAFKVNKDGSIEFAQGAAAGLKGEGPTTSTQTTAQKSLADTQKTITALDDWEKTAKPGDVGIRGVLGEELLDTWLPQFGFKTADIGRMDSRTKLKSTIEGALREVSVDNRFSNADREAIKDVLPKAGMRESFEKSIQTTRTLKTIFAKRALIDAQSAKLPQPPMWAINALSRKSIEEAVETGLIDDEGLIMAFHMGKISAEEAEAFRKKKPIKLP